MAGIDDDLMDSGSVFPQKNEQQVIHSKEQTVVHLVPKKRKKGMDIVFRIIYCIIDALMIVLSIDMMDRVGAYPLVFCVALIIWAAYRILCFTRSKTIDIIIGLFLFVAAAIFYIWAIDDDYHEYTSRILIPTVYLAFFCVWGAIRQKRNDEERNNK